VTPDLLLFQHVVDRGDDFDLLVASLVAVEFEYPGLDVSRYVARVDAFADRARSVVKASSAGRGQVARDGQLVALDRAFFGELGFRGNQDDYYDPRNSFMNEVIERRTGIPISLSVLYIELGRRLGLDLAGLSFPGHFLVRYQAGDELVFIDPFHRGARLDVEALEGRLRRVVGPGAELAEEHLEPASKHHMLTRMLTNLAAIYRRAGDVYRGIAVLERMLVLDPANARVDGELKLLRRRAEGLN
jgi:regulator of sirC expression with transglutaminase-like and TPR domain